MTTHEAHNARVIGKTEIAKNIFAFAFEPDKPVTSAGAGAHIDVHLPSGVARQYSLTHPVSENSSALQIAVLRDRNGRGGSIELCDAVKLNDTIRISTPRNNFRLDPNKPKYVLLAGGIGITPMLSMIRELQSRGDNYQLHICAKSPEHVPYKEMLDLPPWNEHVSYYYSEAQEFRKLDIPALLAHLDEASQVYVCGPDRFIACAEQASRHWPPGRLRLERFTATLDDLNDRQDGSFFVELKRTGGTHEVPKGKSILEVLNDAGVYTESSCLEGVCGTCISSVVTSGEIIHRDACLYDEEKQANTEIAMCVSRGVAGSTIVLDM